MSDIVAPGCRSSRTSGTGWVQLAVDAARLEARRSEGLRQELDGPALTRFAGTAALEVVGGEHAHVLADALGGDCGRHGGGGGEDQR